MFRLRPRRAQLPSIKARYEVSVLEAEIDSQVVPAVLAAGAYSRDQFLAVAQGPAQLVVERAMYSNADGVTWAAGSNALATRLAP